MIGHFLNLAHLMAIENTVTMPDRRQSKMLILLTKVDKIGTEFFFDCHLSPALQQMAIKMIVSSDFRSEFVNC